MVFHSSDSFLYCNGHQNVLTLSIHMVPTSPDRENSSSGPSHSSYCSTLFNVLLSDLRIHDLLKVNVKTFEIRYTNILYEAPINKH